MKNKFLVEHNEIEFRRGNKNDDLNEIAELIYYTDPFIYPFWFKDNMDEAKRYLSKLLLTEGNLFNIDNFYIAYDKTNDHIVGILCAIDKSVTLNYLYDEDKKTNNNYKFTIDNYVKAVEEEVIESKEEDFLYISNICISPSCRGKKIGSYLLGYFISQMEKNGYNTFALDCLLHNLRAKNLYHGMGFKEMKEIVGFDGTDTSKVEVVSFLRKKGNYYPSEFQVSFLDKEESK